MTYRHLRNLVMFFTHNTQYSLLLLIHMQVQCDLVITRNTCVNVCSLNYHNLFLKYKIGLTCLVCVCVRFGIYVLNIFLVERCFWEIKILFGSLVKLHVWLHSCICFSLLEKLFLINLDNCWTPFDSWAIYRDSSIAFYRILDTSQ